MVCWTPPQCLRRRRKDTHLAARADALALDTLCRDKVIDHDILDAAGSLQMLAEGRAPELDEDGRTRAAHPAATGRNAAHAGR